MKQNPYNVRVHKLPCTNVNFHPDGSATALFVPLYPDLEKGCIEDGPAIPVKLQTNALWVCRKLSAEEVERGWGERFIVTFFCGDFGDEFEERDYARAHFAELTSW